jgi:hypothetical protein
MENIDVLMLDYTSAPKTPSNCDGTLSTVFPSGVIDYILTDGGLDDQKGC